VISQSDYFGFGFPTLIENRFKGLGHDILGGFIDFG